MVFTSSIFLYTFLPVFLLLYGPCPRRLKAWLLTAASFVFYGWWNPNFLWLLLGASAMDYQVGRLIARDRARGRGNGGRWLAMSVTANLALLAWFKYANFGAATLRAVLHACGFAGDFAWTDVVLPVGISFYTFQTMSYTIDVYRGEVAATDRFVDFLCYVSMFPQLVAGPIVRYSVVEHELAHRTHTLAGFQRGVLFLQAGMVKKLLLADALAPLADGAFSAPDATGVPALDAWLGLLAYAYQIYFDFSGYSDMAIGMGLMLGFHFPINFDSPYRSRSITEFWRRWHISLSTWLRDYLYLPLGGNRRGTLRTYVNLMVTMLLGGLWHGASWNFLAWGGYQGGWLVLERLAGKRAWYAALPGPLQILPTFVLVLGGWVFFRARDLAHAGDCFVALAGLGHGGATSLAANAPYGELLAATIVVFLLPTSQRLVAAARPWFVLLLQPLFVLAALHLRSTPDDIPFLYFQF